MRKGFLFSIVLASVFLYTAAVSAKTNEFRGLLVHAWRPPGLSSEAEISQLVADARSANFNAIIAQVRIAGEVQYNSPFEPKTKALGELDPLERLLAEAHDTGKGPRIETHAWINVYPVAHRFPPSELQHPYHLHDDWLTMADTGDKFDGEYYKFDPAHPEAQKYLFNVIMDVVSRYDVDGIYLDRIRYHSPTWGYHPVAIERFNRLYHKTGRPARTDADWQQFRRDQVTDLVRKVYLHVLASKPHVKVSAAGITWAGIQTAGSWQNTPTHQRALQDWHGWMKEGIVDFVASMSFFNQDVPEYGADFIEWGNFLKDHRYDRHVVIGAGFYRNSISNVITQIRETQKRSPNGNYADGLSGFSYNDITPNPAQRSQFFQALTRASEHDAQPVPVFAKPAATPEMPWKTRPTKGHVKGFVYGASKDNALDGAKIEIKGKASRTLRTDGTGFYGAVDLEPGDYSVTAYFGGFARKSMEVTISKGSVATLDFVLNRPSLPRIELQPISQATTNDGKATFAVVAQSDTLPLSYQWFLKGEPIFGATDDKFERSPVSDIFAGKHFVVVMNQAGSVTSAPIELEIVQTAVAPTIATPPANAIGKMGGEALLSVVSKGTAPLSFQWRRGETALPGATNAYLRLSKLSLDDSGNYSVRVSNGQGSVVSPSASLGVGYTLSVEPTPRGSVQITETKEIHTAGSTVSIQAIPNAGFVFSSWSGEAVGTENPLVLKMDGNKTVEPRFVPLEIVIDNQDAVLTGDWGKRVLSTDKMGSDYIFGATSNGVSKVATFIPNVEVPGKYNVFITYPCGSNRATNAPFVISCKEGEIALSVDQTKFSKGWSLLASNIVFDAGKAGYVRVSNDTGTLGRIIVADGIRLVYADGQ